MHIEIADHVDLDRAEALVSWLERPHLDRVTITLPGLDTTERERAAVTVLRLFNDCGCAWGLAALVLAGTGALLVRPDGGQGIAGVVLAGLLAAAAGKLLGLAWSRRRLLALLHNLRSAS
ncbi:hypothetical protein C1I95_17700 [Micromonospora craterilacus]|uniref:Uncharacterized protein n=1 Tax=Micromonospora craterilacus TaxID=1655439 RepID=A0A2W2E2C4_9ACTN|nr:hypothetical protein [Micromonospora craterilacus]PZG16421.1 hypothetical protein C1I95_17700 [Micromonospora craterilacus]